MCKLIGGMLYSGKPLIIRDKGENATQSVAIQNSNQCVSNEKLDQAISYYKDLIGDHECVYLI